MRSLALMVVGLALVPAAAGRPSGGTELVFVAVEDADRLVAVEPEAGVVRARLAVPNGPHNVGLSRDGRFVLVTSPPAGAVTLVDAFPARVLHVFRGLRSPHDVHFAPEGRYAYVTEEGGAAVAVLDLTGRRVVRRVTVRSRPHDLAVRPDGARVWVTHGPGAPAITILDTSSPGRARVIGHAPSRSAHDIAFARRGPFVWVTYWGSGLVGKIRAYSRTGRLSLQARPGRLVHHVEVDIVGRLWATDHADGRVFRLSQAGKPLLRLDGCPGAHHVGVGFGRGRVAVACHDSGRLLVYDPHSKRVERYAVGPGPHGAVVAWVP